MRARVKIIIVLVLAALGGAFLLKGPRTVLRAPSEYGVDSLETMELRVFHNLASELWDLGSLRLRKGDYRGALETCRSVKDAETSCGLDERPGIFSGLNRAIGNGADFRIIASLAARRQYTEALALADKILTGPLPPETEARARLMKAEILRAEGRDCAAELGGGLRIIVGLLEGYRKKEYAVHRCLPAKVPSPLARPWLMRLVSYQNLVRDPLDTSFCWGSWEAPPEGPTLEALARAVRRRIKGENAPLYLRDERRPSIFTSVYLLGAVPNSDSTIDLLGQAGLASNAFPRFPSMGPDEYRAWLCGYVEKINTLLRLRDFAGAEARLREMADVIGSGNEPLAEARLRRVRNEHIRLLVANGEFERAALIAKALLDRDPEKATVLNREAVLHHMAGRIAAERGDLNSAELELGTAASLSLALLRHISMERRRGERSR
jgi:hypothetical protein